MKRKLSDSDCLFVAAILAGLLFYSVILVSYPYLHDEYFYVSIPFRLIKGDSLIQHEWHLSQFSTLFTYWPTKAWLMLKGSTEGILIFLRYVFLTVYVALAATIYRFFRVYGKWAVAASTIFFTQVPYRVLALSYNSLFVIFMVLLCLCLLSLAKLPRAGMFFLAGICYGCCCVCNPLFCIVYPLWLLCFPVRRIGKRRKKTKQETTLTDWQDWFFSRTAGVYSCLGIGTIATIAIAFFLLTGGTFDSLFYNISLLLESTEYKLSFPAFVDKVYTTLQSFNIISLKMPFLLPLFYTAMYYDKKKYSNVRRKKYLGIALGLAGMYIVGMYCNCTIWLSELWHVGNMFSLPLVIISTTCYCLTEKKNKTLFYCMWVTSAIAALFQYWASTTLLMALGYIFAINNIAGVLFAGDLYKELCETKTESEMHMDSKSADPAVISRRLICCGLCLQILFHIFVAQFAQLPQSGSVMAKEGPCAGMLLSMDRYSDYTKSLHNLDIIRERSGDGDPVLVASYCSWMYLYLDRPLATHTAWFQGLLQPEYLISYYTQNPEQIPRYIYVESVDYDVRLENIRLAGTMFTFTEEKLSGGTLLTVTGCKFS